VHEQNSYPRAKSKGITFDDANPNTPFIRTFLMEKIHQTLTEFECGDFETSRFIEWFVENSRFWSSQESQAAFNAYARERLSDKVGYTRRRQDAFNVIDRYFDKRELLELDDIVAAIRFCAKPEPMPHAVRHNAEVCIIDLPKQPKQKRDYLLKVDAVFLPMLELLYPWQRVEDRVVKFVPTGSLIREFHLEQLAFWFKYRNCSREEMQEALAFHSADRLDWSSRNLYSRWREGLLAERYASRVDPLPVDTGCVPTFDARHGYRKGTVIIPPTAPNRVGVWVPKPSRSSRVVPLDADLLGKLG
jgi:hypothetical protein